MLLTRAALLAPGGADIVGLVAWREETAWAPAVVAARAWAVGAAVVASVCADELVARGEQRGSGRQCPVCREPFVALQAIFF